MSGWTDAHCHLQEEFLSPGSEVALDIAAALERAAEAGVDRAVVVGTDPVTSREAVALAQSAPGPVDVWATVGLHPHEGLRGLEDVLAQARERPDRLVGIGECGLDYFYEHAPRDDQRRSFGAQIDLAHELGLALVIHARDAWDDLFEVLGVHGVPPRTVIHCFTGGPAEAERCLALGADISISGVVTFKNAQPVRDALALVPLERLHVETDSPFLAPVPHRGERNEPAHVAVVGRHVAALLGREPELVKAATAANSARLFALP